MRKVVCVPSVLTRPVTYQTNNRSKILRSLRNSWSFYTRSHRRIYREAWRGLTNNVRSYMRLCCKYGQEDEWCGYYRGVSNHILRLCIVKACNVTQLCGYYDFNSINNGIRLYLRIHNQIRRGHPLHKNHCFFGE